MFAISLSYLLHFAAPVTAMVLSDLNLFVLRFFLNLVDSLQACSLVSLGLLLQPLAGESWNCDLRSTRLWSHRGIASPAESMQDGVVKKERGAPDGQCFIYHQLSSFIIISYYFSSVRVLHSISSCHIIPKPWRRTFAPPAF